VRRAQDLWLGNATRSLNRVILIQAESLAIAWTSTTAREWPRVRTSHHHYQMHCICSTLTGGHSLFSCRTSLRLPSMSSPFHSHSSLAFKPIVSSCAFEGHPQKPTNREQVRASEPEPPRHMIETRLRRTRDVAGSVAEASEMLYHKSHVYYSDRSGQLSADHDGEVEKRMQMQTVHK
jgi:hypothetical protein